MVLLMMGSQKVSSSLAQRHYAYVIPLTLSHHASILSSRMIPGRVSKVQQNKIFFEKERDHIHTTFTTVYYYNCSIISCSH